MREIKVGNRDKEGKIMKITKITEELILKQGYYKTSTNQIAKEADVSIGLVYKYFPKGKISVLKAIAEREYTDRMNKISTYPKEKLENFLRYALNQMLDHHKKHKELTLALEIALLTDEEFKKDYNYILDKELKHFSSLIVKLLQDTTFVGEQERERMSILLIHMIDGLIHRHLFYPPVFDMDEEFIEYLTKLSVRILQS